MIISQFLKQFLQRSRIVISNKRFRPKDARTLPMAVAWRWWVAAAVHFLAFQVPHTTIGLAGSCSKFVPRSCHTHTPLEMLSSKWGCFKNKIEIRSCACLVAASQMHPCPSPRLKNSISLSRTHSFIHFFLTFTAANISTHPILDQLVRRDGDSLHPENAAGHGTFCTVAFSGEPP